MFRYYFAFLIFFFARHACFASPSTFVSSAMLAFEIAEFPEENDNNVSGTHVETHVSLITLNRNLKAALLATLTLLLAFSFAVYYLKKRVVRLAQLNKMGSMQVSDEEMHSLQIEGADIELLKIALNEERAKVVRYEIQKKELLAYIDELKVMQGSTEVKHKTIQLQRIFAEQKSEDIANKVENTAKVLYPELVEAVQKGYPELNRLELQYCMMLTLGYNLDEIRAVLGRSEKAIKSLRYRIRKKMQLDNSQSLKKFIQEMKDYLAENQDIIVSEAFSRPT